MLNICLWLIWYLDFECTYRSRKGYYLQIISNFYPKIRYKNLRIKRDFLGHHLLYVCTLYLCMFIAKDMLFSPISFPLTQCKQNIQTKSHTNLFYTQKNMFILVCLKCNILNNRKLCLEVKTTAFRRKKHSRKNLYNERITNGLIH